MGITEMRLNPARLTDADYIERRLFQLFVIFHRDHCVQPSCEYIYATARISAGIYVYLYMTRAKTHQEIHLPPSAAMDLLSPEKVAVYVAELGRWDAGRGLVVN